MPPPPAAAGLSNQKQKGIVATAHDASSSIRAQSKKDKGVANEGGDRASMNRDVVKAVLASPLTVAWPNIPRHLQTTVMHALHQLVPAQVADYHVSRARCHTKEKRVARRQRRAVLPDGKSGGEGDGGVEAADVGRTKEIEDDSVKRKAHPSSAEPPAKKLRPDTNQAGESDQPVNRPAHQPRPARPDVLAHLVLGINEVIKALERQIDELKLRLLIMADGLNGRTLSKPAFNGESHQGPNHLLPTAPRSPSPESDDNEAGTTNGEEPPGPSVSAGQLSFIVVPLLSVNPQSLVSPIPSYCATYNALVYQYSHLAKIVKTRIKSAELAELLGEEREEVRVVPLGNVEKEMAEMVGLRRLACLGIKRSHPGLEGLQRLLPKSVLHPPRHSITLPYPTSSLKVYNNRPSKPNTSTPSTTTPIPHVHYAPLHVKGIQTTVPVDNAARKAKRLEEVRKKRVEAKEKKRLVRESIQKVGIKAKGKRTDKANKTKGKGEGPSQKKRSKGGESSKEGAASA